MISGSISPQKNTHDEIKGHTASTFWNISLTINGVQDLIYVN
jgi:hypothetical protein